MRKLNNKYTKLVLVPIAIVLIAMASPTERYFEIAKNLDIFATLFKEVNAYYVDEIQPDDLIKTGIDAMLSSLDPYTNYIPEEEIESFRTLTTGQYAGIGALIGRVNNKTVITMPYEGFAAFKAGLKIGDELIQIDDTIVKGKSISEISSLLKGQANTSVKIQIGRLGQEQPLTFEFKREKIKVGNVPYADLVSNETGYIKLEDFTPGAGKEVASALKELKKKGAKSIILDLRDNPGGLLNEAVNVANVFVGKNREVVSTKGKLKEWNKTYKTLNNPVDVDIPLVVLTSGGSASAAEIVAGVIQDYDRGVLIGSRTFGKGLVQTTRPLTYNSQLKVTTAKYYIPSGRCIQALDYSNRKEDGTVSRIADSLRQEFKTKSGRLVYDGGGLSPDIDIPVQYYAPITFSLVSKGLIFEYANVYSSRNKESVSARDFQLTEKEYADFTNWLGDKEYDYTTKVESNLIKLEESAKKEKYFEDIESQLEELKNKVKHNREKDLVRFREEIEQSLKEEIVARQFLEKGSIEASFNKDEGLNKSIEILADHKEYLKILRHN